MEVNRASFLRNAKQKCEVREIVKNHISSSVKTCALFELKPSSGYTIIL